MKSQIEFPNHVQTFEAQPDGSINVKCKQKFEMWPTEEREFEPAFPENENPVSIE